MVDADCRREPGALAQYLDEVADALEALWLRWDAGQDYDPTTWRAAVDALKTGRLLLITSLDVADRGAIAEVAEQLREAAGLVQTGSGEPTLPVDWRTGAKCIREAVDQLRMLSSL
jgi:hypothetical protein